VASRPRVPACGSPIIIRGEYIGEISLKGRRRRGGVYVRRLRRRLLFVIRFTRFRSKYFRRKVHFRKCRKILLDDRVGNEERFSLFESKPNRSKFFLRKMRIEERLPSCLWTSYVYAYFSFIFTIHKYVTNINRYNVREIGTIYRI